MTPDASTRTPYTPTTTQNMPPSLSSEQPLGEDHSTSVPSGSTALSLATQRLSRSRALIQTALGPYPNTAKSSATSINNRLPGTPEHASPAGLSSIPGFALGVEAVKFWWSRHPLRLAITLLAKTADASIKPMAQRNPVALVAGAFLVGGLLAWARPWRLVVKPILFVGVMPQITSALVTHFSASANKHANHTKH